MPKRTLCLALAAALLAGLAAGCARQPEPAPAARAGAYVEEDITPDGDPILCTAVAADGTLHCLTGKSSFAAAEALPDPAAPAPVHWYTMAPGGQEWVERTDHAFAQAMATLAGLPWQYANASAAIDADGTLYWAVYGIQYAEGSHDAAYCGERWFRVEGGTAVPLDGAPGGYIGMALPAPDLNAYPVPNATALCGDTVLRDYSDGTLKAFALDGSEQKPALPDLAAAGARLLCAGNGVYYLWNDTAKQLLRCLLGGTTLEIILDGARYAVGAADAHVSGIGCAAGPDDTLYLCCNSAGNDRLYRYRWDETRQVADEGTVTVFSLYENRDIRAAAAALQRSSGITVEYSCAIDSTDWGNAAPEERAARGEDALRQLNTRLLAGQGPDVLVLDDMDIDGLVRQGLLADLDGLVSAETLAALLPNLAAAWRDENGLRALPAACAPWMVGGEEQDIAGLDGISDIAAAIERGVTDTVYAVQSDAYPHKRELVCWFRSWRQTFETFYPLYANAVWAGGRLNTAPYGHLLAVTKRITDHNGFVCAYGGDDGRAAELAPGASLHDYGYYGTTNQTLSYYQNGYFQFFCDTMSSAVPDSAAFALHAARTGRENAGALRALTGDDGETAVRPVTVVGVNASSTNKALAARLLEALFSPAVQEGCYTGLPARADILAGQWAAGLAEAGTACETDLAALVGAMDVVEYIPTLESAAWAGAWAYYSGAGLDAACAAAEKEAALWLAER